MTKRKRTPLVKFSHVDVRTYDMDVGGGVPADDGPPLGLAWTVRGQTSTKMDEYEKQRQQQHRSPKEKYCMESLDSSVRQRMLQSAGVTPQQIWTASREVEKLNRERWEASEALFTDAWLFRAARGADASEVLAMLGQHECAGAQLCVSQVAGWDSEEALAAELAPSLGVKAPSLLAPPVCTAGAAAGAAAIIWSACATAMQELDAHLVLVLDCAGEKALPKSGLLLLGRLVGCVANAHVAAQVLHSQRGNVSVVLRGWTDDKIEADWEDDDRDEFRIAPLQ